MQEIKKKFEALLADACSLFSSCLWVFAFTVQKTFTPLFSKLRFFTIKHEGTKTERHEGVVSRDKFFFLNSQNQKVAFACWNYLNPNHYNLFLSRKISIFAGGIFL